MSTRELNILERCFTAEVEAALRKSPLDVAQFKSKLADKLAADGYIVKATITLGGRFPVTIEGYRLTELGRLTYCTSL